MLAEGAEKDEKEGRSDGDEGEDVAPECAIDGRCDIPEDLRLDVSERNAALGNDDEVVVERVHDEGVCRDDGEVFRILLEPRLKQHDEGNYEVAED